MRLQCSCSRSGDVERAPLLCCECSLSTPGHVDSTQTVPSTCVPECCKIIPCAITNVWHRPYEVDSVLILFASIWCLTSIASSLNVYPLVFQIPLICHWMTSQTSSLFYELRIVSTVRRTLVTYVLISIIHSCILYALVDEYEKTNDQDQSSSHDDDEHQYNLTILLGVAIINLIFMTTNCIVTFMIYVWWKNIHLPLVLLSLDSRDLHSMDSNEAAYAVAVQLTQSSNNNMTMSTTATTPTGLHQTTTPSLNVVVGVLVRNNSEEEENEPQLGDSDGGFNINPYQYSSTTYRC